MQSQSWRIREELFSLGRFSQFSFTCRTAKGAIFIQAQSWSLGEKLSSFEGFYN